MKIIILKEKLLKGLSFLTRISSKNITLPILNNILIESEKNFLTTTVTDLEVAIKHWAFAKTEKQGKVAVASDVFFNTTRFLPDKKPIIITSDGDNMVIESDNFKTKINGLPVNDFPVIPVVKKDVFFTISATSFCSALSCVCENASLSNIRPEISGVFVSINNKEAKVVATDSFRLGEKTISFTKPLNLKKEYSFILPQKTVKEIISIFSDQNKERETEKQLNIYIDSNQVLIESLMEEEKKNSIPEIHIVSRLVEGEYPEYKEIIPQKHDTQVVVNKDAFLSQIKVASLFSGKTNEVKIKIDPKKESINIFSQNPDLGEHNSSSVAKIKGSAQEVSFNAKFLLDGLLKIKSPDVVFEITKKNNDFGPGVLRPLNDSNYIYVLMPLKTD